MMIFLRGETLEHLVSLLQAVVTGNERLSNIAPSLAPDIIAAIFSFNLDRKIFYRCWIFQLTVCYALPRINGVSFG